MSLEQTREELLTMQIESDAIEMSKLQDKIEAKDAAWRSAEAEVEYEKAYNAGQAEAHKQVIRHLLTYIIRG